MIAEIQRLKAMGLGKRAVSRLLKISRNTLRKYWEPGEEGVSTESGASYRAPWSDRIDWEAVKKKLGQGQTLLHYWEEFREVLSPEDPVQQVSYVSFWREFRRRYPESPIRFGKDFEPGSCVEIDYKGSPPGFGYIDPRTGTFVVCELFGAMLRHSRFLSVDASLTQSREDFFRSIDQAFRDFGGCPTISVTDNLTPAVKKASRKGDADLNPDYALFCAHYGTVAIPAGPGRPTEKDGIEKELHLFWRWFAHSLREKSFSSLVELRAVTRTACERYNNRIQRRMGQSRRERLEAERAVMAPVPEAPYEFCLWKKVRPHPDCHVQVNKNFYSVPHRLRGKTLEARIGTATIEIFEGTERVAVHPLLPSNLQGHYQSQMGHFPPANAFLLEALPNILREKAQKAGPQTLDLVNRLFALGNHPLRFLRRVQGILGLLKEVTGAEMESAIETSRNLGVALPRPSEILAIVRYARTQTGEIPEVCRTPNRYLRGGLGAPAPIPEALET